jgi:hypothetical protein
MVKKKPKRITLDLGESSIQRIARLQEALEARTMVSTIEKALQLLEFVVDKADEGYEFLLRNRQTGQAEQVTILEVRRRTQGGLAEREGERSWDSKASLAPSPEAR